MQIKSFTCWLVEVERGPQFVWRDGLPTSDSDSPRGTKPRHAIIRMDTDEGHSGTVIKPHGDAIFDMAAAVITTSLAKTRC